MDLRALDPAPGRRSSPTSRTGSPPACCCGPSTSSPARLQLGRHGPARGRRAPRGLARRRLLRHAVGARAALMRGARPARRSPAPSSSRSRTSTRCSSACGGAAPPAAARPRHPARPAGARERRVRAPAKDAGRLAGPLRAAPPAARASRSGRRCSCWAIPPTCAPSAWRRRTSARSRAPWAYEAPSARAGEDQPRPDPRPGQALRRPARARERDAVLSLADELTLEPAPAGQARDEVICPGVRGARTSRRPRWRRSGPPPAGRPRRAPEHREADPRGRGPRRRLRRRGRRPAPGQRRLRARRRAAAARPSPESSEPTCPAQVAPGRWLATGAGEELRALAPPAWPFGVLILPVAAALSTAQVYGEADRLGLAREAAELDRLAADMIAALGGGTPLPAQAGPARERPAAGGDLAVPRDRDRARAGALRRRRARARERIRADRARALQRPRRPRPGGSCPRPPGRAGAQRARPGAAVGRAGARALRRPARPCGRMPDGHSAGPVTARCATISADR